MSKEDDKIHLFYNNFLILRYRNIKVVLLLYPLAAFEQLLKDLY
jgi:hypothetical protein